jgi:hypothetical protein
MDYSLFVDTLPGKYKDWGTAKCQPENPAFADLLKSVCGMTTASVLQLLNFAVSWLEDREIYCEVGTYQGATLIGALGGNQAIGHGIDNFSEFNDKENEAILMENCKNQLVRAKDRVVIHRDDCEKTLTHPSFNSRIGVFFYDGAHDYRSTLMALLLARRHLADRALIVVDDWNFKHVQQAVHDFLAVIDETRVELTLTTNHNGEEPWWNGLIVISCDCIRLAQAGPPHKIKTVCDRIYSIRDGQE